MDHAPKREDGIFLPLFSRPKSRNGGFQPWILRISRSSRTAGSPAAPPYCTSTIEGHRVEAARIKDGPYTDSEHYGFILARDDHGCYVTWQFHLLEGNTVTAYWGHYFGNDRDAAVRDFDARGD